MLWSFNRQMEVIKMTSLCTSKSWRQAGACKSPSWRTAKEVIDKPNAHARFSKENAQHISNKGCPQAMTEFCVANEQHVQNIIEWNKGCKGTFHHDCVGWQANLNRSNCKVPARARPTHREAELPTQGAQRGRPCGCEKIYQKRTWQTRLMHRTSHDR